MSKLSPIDSLADLIAVSRETAEKQMANLNAAVERTSQNVERSIERIEMWNSLPVGAAWKTRPLSITQLIQKNVQRWKKNMAGS